MRGDGVRYLHGGFAVEFRIVGQHPPEHGDIGGRVGLAQQIGGFGLNGFSGQRAVGERVVGSTGTKQPIMAGLNRAINARSTFSGAQRADE